HCRATRRVAWNWPRDGPEDRDVSESARAVHLGRRPRRNTRNRAVPNRRPSRAGDPVSIRPAPPHLLAAALAVGLALANVTRLVTAPLVLSFLAAAAAMLVGSTIARLAALAALLGLIGWWWASVRLDMLDRSPLTADIGRAGRAQLVVTAPPVAGR